MKLKAPFPWFGGKSRVAPQVWAALGDVDNYVEPFAGSLAVLLERPDWHQGYVETVNDKDEYIANFWRAVQHDPEAVAFHADWPVTETDLFSRHLWLVSEGKRQMQAGLAADPEWCDAKIAGWWVWGQSCWIGGGWCSGKGPWSLDESGQLVYRHGGRGVNRQRPHLGDAGSGVKRQRLHLGRGRGVNRKHQDLLDYMQALADRLRRVRVCCGDWSRVVTTGALSHGKTIGVFLDPPYSAEAGRDGNLYSVEDLTVAHDVRRWAIEHGDNPRLRIVLAGYEGEHDMPDSWRVLAWKANGGMSNSRKNGANENKHRERLWFSPHCLTDVAGTGFFVGGQDSGVPKEGA